MNQIECYLHWIKAYETNTSSLSQDISIEDSLAHVLGSKEHCGHVRGMGLGPCPSRVFWYTRNFHFGTSSSCPSYSELQNQVIEHSFSCVAIWCCLLWIVMPRL